MGLFGLLIFLIIGGIAGWLAGNIMRGGGFGIVANIVIGIIGSFIGGLLLGVLGFAAWGFFARIISATIGAVVLLWIVDKVKSR